MKKILRIIVSITLVLSLTACGGQVVPDKEENTTQPQSSNEEIQSADTTSDKQEPESNPDIETPIYSIKIDGEEYTFPMSYETFKAYGWTYYVPEEDDVSQWSWGIAGHTTSSKMFYDKGDIKCLEFIFYNPSDEETSYDNCQVIGVIVTYDQIIEGKDAKHFMNIPAGSITINDLEIGVATKKQVYEKLGKDWSQRDIEDISNDGWDIFYYYFSEESDTDTMTITFDENGIFSEMTYTNKKS